MAKAKRDPMIEVYTVHHSPLGRRGEVVWVDGTDKMVQHWLDEGVIVVVERPKVTKPKG